MGLTGVKPSLRRTMSKRAYAIEELAGKYELNGYELRFFRPDLSDHVRAHPDLFPTEIFTDAAALWLPLFACLPFSRPQVRDRQEALLAANAGIPVVLFVWASSRTARFPKIRGGFQ